LTLIPDFVTVEEAAQIIKDIDASPWMDSLKRRVQHYGYLYDYKRRTVDASLYLGNLPPWAQQLATRVHQAGYIGLPPDQVIVNEYEPGQGIAKHVDCEPCFGDTILSLSLGSGCVMEFHQDDHKIPIWLAPRALLVMQHEARYEWQHGIPARKSDVWAEQRHPRSRRVSVTLRKVILSE